MISDASLLTFSEKCGFRQRPRRRSYAPCQRSTNDVLSPFPYRGCGCKRQIAPVPYENICILRSHGAHQQFTAANKLKHTTENSLCLASAHIRSCSSMTSTDTDLVSSVDANESKKFHRTLSRLFTTRKHPIFHCQTDGNRHEQEFICVCNEIPIQFPASAFPSALRCFIWKLFDNMNHTFTRLSYGIAVERAHGTRSRLSLSLLHRTDDARRLWVLRLVACGYAEN